MLLLKSGYSWIQYISFEKEIENRKSAYHKVLIDTQRNRPGENVTEWLRFFLSCLSHIQENLLIKLTQRRKDNITSNPRQRKLLFYIENHPGCSSGEMASKLDLALPTVKKDLRELVERKVIYIEGIGRGTAYFLV